MKPQDLDDMPPGFVLRRVKPHQALNLGFTETDVWLAGGEVNEAELTGWMAAPTPAEAVERLRAKIAKETAT